MSKLAETLKERYFGDDVHPYRIFEQEVGHRLHPSGALLDLGCGRGAPVLLKFKGRAGRLLGIDVVEFHEGLAGLELHRADVGTIPLESETVDVVMARSVMEHITDPSQVYAEIYRILKPGGCFIFLTGNQWDYSALIAMLVPNRFHPWIVSKTEGRAPEDVFPVVYKTNTYRAVRLLSAASGFEIVRFEYLGQYPSYFMFNGVLFFFATGWEKLLRRLNSLRFLRGWILVTLRRPEESNTEREQASA